MWIRSQDGKYKVEYTLDNCDDFTVESDEKKWFVCYQADYHYLILGEYSTREKAVKIGDSIIRAFAKRNKDFQMPQDDEVEL